MENAGLIMEVEPLHVVKIIVHITKTSRNNNAWISLLHRKMTSAYPQ
jgi:hypothetical protein